MFAVTAVKDRLQEGVSRCINDFKDAGITVWMLTGDKALTAKMIAIQSGLIKQINSSSTFIQLKESSNLEEIKLEI